MSRRCSECVVGVLFCYCGSHTYLLASMPGGYRSRMGKGQLFRNGKPRVQVLRLNLHVPIVFKEGLTVEGLRGQVERGGNNLLVCPQSLYHLDPCDISQIMGKPPPQKDVQCFYPTLTVSDKGFSAAAVYQAQPVTKNLAQKPAAQLSAAKQDSAQTVPMGTLNTQPPVAERDIPGVAMDTDKGPVRGAEGESDLQVTPPSAFLR